MAYSICIFEDKRSTQLYPLTLTRPIFDLRCGIFTLKERIVRQFPGHPRSLCCRAYLRDFIQKENTSFQINSVDSDACLFISGHVMDADLAKALDSSEQRILLYKDRVLAAFVRGSNIARFIRSLENDSDTGGLEDIDHVELDHANVIEYPWDLVHQNPSQIERDFNGLNKGGWLEGVVSENAILVNENNIYIGKNTVIKPGAILDAEKGPIYIGENVTIMHNAVIEGPAFIGDGSTIKIAAKIYEGTSIGEVCKVGGEVEESIIHSHSNKQHDGFLGHAYLGQWVNLGADTNNSDLKNNYASVKVYINGEFVDSESMFAGLFMGDHSKAGINTMFNTGASVGTMCNVFGAGFPPKHVPSFSWGGAEGLVEYDFKKAMETARMVMARRDKELSQEYEGIFRHLFEMTHNERVQYYQ